MSSAEAVPLSSDGPELPDVVADVIRVQLTRRRMSQRELTRRLGESHTWATRRLGVGPERVPIDTAEMDRVAAVLGMTSLALLREVFAEYERRREFAATTSRTSNPG